MARILAISSQVARGTVGLSIIVPALHAMGHEVIALPTVILSNHPGHPHVAGTPVDPAVLARMLEALDANGWLAGVDSVLTGYLPSVDHVMFATAAVQLVAERRGRERLTFLCDPVLGDDPKGLYIDRAAAEAIRDVLISSADLATPNRFELEFLTGQPVTSHWDAATVSVGPCVTFATSIPLPGAMGQTTDIANVCLSAGDATMARVPRRASAPNGTGDLFSALVISAWLKRQSFAQVLSFATAGVDLALDGSALDAIPVGALPRAESPLSWPVSSLALVHGERQFQP